MNYDVIIVGGGPAGSSAAVCLAESGARVLLLEEKRMPREKLCGEFITPECFPSLGRLGVRDRLMAAGAQKITRLCLTASNGRTVQASIAEMSGEGSSAISLSRARFDHILFERAREAGTDCLEGIAVKECLYEGDRPVGVEAVALPEGKTVRFGATLIVDASGRNSRLTVGRRERIGGRKGTRHYAMKAHLEGVSGMEERVELYFFPGGYGGLSPVEDGLTNLCFIVNEETLKAAGGDAAEILRRTVMKNYLAAERLVRAEVTGKWHSAGPLTFGARADAGRSVIAIGDSAGMIDPFTGTGIQVALRTGEMVAEAIIECLEPVPCAYTAGSASARAGAIGYSSPGRPGLIQQVLESYRARYDREFGKRMKVAGILRKAALSSSVANFAATVLAYAPWLARHVLRATRSSGQ
ncbi:MAG: FAD-dependent monooxygenase [Blastocatellia bacterium]|nr:FAD-dependent monooxygenase [Blastocatellia bacterium]